MFIFNVIYKTKIQIWGWWERINEIKIKQKWKTQKKPPIVEKI